VTVQDEVRINQLKTAIQFDVHKWSDYPQVKAVCDALFDEVLAYRKEQNPKARSVKPDKVKKHLRVLLIDLYVASQGSNPWRGVSKRKEDYREKESRYRRIFLTYDFLIPLINDLDALGYVEQVRGFKEKTTGKGFRTRIKATPHLIDLIEAPTFGIGEVIAQKGLIDLVTDNPEATRELIILRDQNGQPVEYEDDGTTNAMRHNLELINAKLAKEHITLRASNEEFEAIHQRLIGDADKDREPIDFSRKSLHRVFNGDFRHGGRFYGGWWIGVPNEFRKCIEINRKHTVEVDFSAHHPRMLYAREGLKPPKYPYKIEGCPFPPEVLKQVFLVLLNANSKTATIKACAQHGIKDVPEVLKFLETHHHLISHYFYSGVGLELQYEDSILAERIMLTMMGRSGAVVLPVHDSFIVRASYQDELEEVMELVFAEMYKVKPEMKAKATILTEQQTQDEESEDINTGFVTHDLEKLIQEQEKYSHSIRLFGL
jgi:hypothetical protein